MPFTRQSEQVPDVFDELDNLHVEVALTQRQLCSHNNA